MTVKRSIYRGMAVVIAGNLLIVVLPDLAIFTLFGITLILCFFISQIDITNYSPDSYYEVGFTYTIFSIIGSMIVLSISGLDEDGFVAILGNFAIALVTSAFGLVLRSSSENKAVYHDLDEYNRSIQELSTSLQLITDDLNKATLKLIDKLNKQSSKIDRITVNLTSDIQTSLNSFNSNIESQRVSERSIVESTDRLLNSVEIHINTISTFNNIVNDLIEKINSIQFHKETIQDELFELKNLIKINAEILDGTIGSNFENLDSKINQIINQYNPNDNPNIIDNIKEEILQELYSIKSSVNTMNSRLIKKTEAPLIKENRDYNSKKKSGFWGRFFK